MYGRHMYPTMPATARSPPGTLRETLIRDPADKSDNAESALVVRAVGQEQVRAWLMRRRGGSDRCGGTPPGGIGDRIALMTLWGRSCVEVEVWASLPCSSSSQ